MRFGNGNDSSMNKTSIGKIRRAQLITTFGPGAIAEMPNYTVIMAAADHWDPKSSLFHEPNLQKLLGVKGFRRPYTSESQDPKGNPDVPAYRFPRIHFCPKCGKLDDYYSFGDPDKKRCVVCNADLVPSRFVIACINGHLEDFPFEWWAHQGDTSDCIEPNNHNKTIIEFMNNTGGLSSIVISCEKCGKKRSMEGCMNSDALKGYKCFGKRPWIGFSKETNDPTDCQGIMRALQRGGSNVYFSLLQSALTIPPYTGKLQKKIIDEMGKFQTAFENSIEDPGLDVLITVLFDDILKEGRFTSEEIKYEIMKIRGAADPSKQNYTEKTMYEDEYKALCAGYQGEDDEEEFHAVVSSVPFAFREYIDKIVLVKRLREVQALKGFRRITPVRPEDTEENRDYFGVTNNEFTPVFNKDQGWRPAIEMRGEGIFIKLDSQKILAWEKAVGERYNSMRKRLGVLNIGKNMFSSRYVLLHTLSHLLIRQLTIDCGYQEAALKERIYSTYPNEGIDMAGILIYTSTSDSDGSLGGLVRQGEYELFEGTLRNILQEASWCSSDPLCINSNDQGYNSLNYAACHACTLLPETSCESRNCLLDRVSIVGKPDNRSLGYFNAFLGE